MIRYFFLFATLGTGLAGMARAETSPADIASTAVIVDAHDLDLASVKGRGQLRQRLSHAAREACSVSPVDLAARNAEKACRVQAVDQAMAKAVGEALAAR